MAVKYDRIDDTCGRTRRAGPQITDRLVSLLESIPGASVLDIGYWTPRVAMTGRPAGLHGRRRRFKRTFTVAREP